MSAERTPIQQRCNFPPIDDPLLDYLDDHDLFAYGLPDPDETDESPRTQALRDRDHDRVKLLKFITEHPSGVTLQNLTSHVLKGVHSDRCQVTLDGSDLDYQFARRFVTDLAFADPQLAQIERIDGIRFVTPTHNSLTLISEGISETPRVGNEIIHDREYARNLLANVRTSLKRLTDGQKNLLANSLSNYIERTGDYKLLFDVHGPRNQTQRMTKDYATRFTDDGRQNKAFARLQDSLEYGYDMAQTAVFVTLTTDPKHFDSLLGAIESINENFHRLTQYMSGDPSTKGDTRRADLPAYSTELDDHLTSRPREKLEYVKVLEYTEAGYPHLHVLFFDPPRREKDGMPWFAHVNELKKKWSDYGQGEIVDAYPLTYRDDLDDVGHFGNTVVHDSDANPIYVDTDGNEVPKANQDATPKKEPVSEGFVCWYEYGDHDHSQEWVQQQKRYGQSDEKRPIDFDGRDDVAQEKTAGAYIGKYVSKMFETLKKDDITAVDDDADAAPWKLALYWATQRQFWSISYGIRDAIRLDGDLSHDEQAATDWCSRETLTRLVEKEHPDARTPTDLDGSPTESAIHRIMRGYPVTIEFLGAFAYWDLPPRDTRAQDLEVVERSDREPGGVDLRSTGDRPPPVADVFG